MSQLSLNALLWCLGLAAQATLLALVFLRSSAPGSAASVARRLPALALLLAFYLLRSIALYALFGHLGPADYHSLYEALAFADLLLQLVLATSIGVGLAHPAGAWTTQRALRLSLLPLAVATVSWLVYALLPANSPIPPDRFQIFNWLLMLVLGAFSVLLPTAPPLLRRVSVGLAGYGALGIGATALRTVAALHRDAHSYALGSYVLAGAWLLIVFYWIVTLRATPAQPTPLPTLQAC